MFGNSGNHKTPEKNVESASDASGGELTREKMCAEIKQ